MDSNAFQLHLATAPTIDEILREGARRALQAAIEREVDEYVERHRGYLDPQGHRLVVRNGQPRRLPDDGFQTGGISTESLAETQRQHAAARGHRRSDLQERNPTRRLICRGHPRLLGITRAGYEVGGGCTSLGILAFILKAVELCRMRPRGAAPSGAKIDGFEIFFGEIPM
jgi:hypothetical protein